MRNSERTVYSIGGQTIAVVNEDARGNKTILRDGVALPYSDGVLSSIALQIARDGRTLTVNHNGTTSHFKR